MREYLANLAAIEEMQAEMFAALREGAVDEDAMQLLNEYAVIERSPDTFTTDMRVMATSVGDSICAEMGWSERRALKNGYITLLHPDDRERVFDDLVVSTGARRIFSSEYRVISRGGWQMVRGVATPTCKADGTFVGLKGTIAAI